MMGEFNMVRGFRLLATTYPILFIASLAYLAMEPAAPAVSTLPDLAQVTYNAALHVGMVVLIVWLVWQVAAAAATPEGSLIHLMDIVVAVIERASLLAVGLVGVRVLSPELVWALKTIKNNPDASLATLAALVMVWAVFATASRRRYPTANNVVGAGAAGMVAKRYPRATKDIYRTAVHEVGHVLLYAVCEEVPNDLTVKVFEEIGHFDEYRGHVTHTRPTPEVYTESFLRWSMLLNLAGGEAEALICGERADGSEKDNRDWIRDATRYLKAGFGEVFYAEAGSESCVAHNRVVLNVLKENHIMQLKEYLAVNEPLLRELTDVLVKRKTIVREDLLAYFHRVVFTTGVKRSLAAERGNNGQENLQ